MSQELFLLSVHGNVVVVSCLNACSKGLSGEVIFMHSLFVGGLGLEVLHRGGDICGIFVHSALTLEFVLGQFCLPGVPGRKPTGLSRKAGVVGL